MLLGRDSKRHKEFGTVGGEVGKSSEVAGSPIKAHAEVAVGERGFEGYYFGCGPGLG